MVAIRPVNLPDDRAALLALDCSFVTDRIYRVVGSAESFSLVEEQVYPPLRKTFPLADDFGTARTWEAGFIAEEGGALGGFIAFSHRAWNRRTEIAHCYVAPGAGARRRARVAGGDCHGGAKTRDALPLARNPHQRLPCDRLLSPPGLHPLRPRPGPLRPCGTGGRRGCPLLRPPAGCAPARTRQPMNPHHRYVARWPSPACARYTIGKMRAKYSGTSVPSWRREAR